MSDPREVLDAIAQRVGRMTKPDPTGQRTYGMDERGGIAPDTYLTAADRAAGDFDCIGHIAGDLRSLVLAVRAVLDRHKPWSSMPIRCEACLQVWPCPDYRNVTGALHLDRTRVTR